MLTLARRRPLLPGYAPGEKDRRARSLAVESAPAPATGGGVGIVRPRLQYRVPGTQTRVGVELPIAAFFTAGGLRVLRPMAVVSGRF